MLVTTTVHWLLLLGGLMLPISTAGSNLIFALLALLTLLQKELRREFFKQFLNLPPVYTACALGGLLAFGLLLHGPVSTEMVGYFLKYRKLFYVGLLAPCFLLPYSRQFLAIGFIASCAITALLLLLQHLHIEFSLIPYVKQGIFKNYLETNVCLAVAYLLCLHQITLEPAQKKYYMYIILLLTTVILSISPGRSGQILWWIFSALWIYQYCSRRQALGVIVGLVILQGLVFTFSETAHSRLQQIPREIKQFYQHQENHSSLGLRLHFVERSWQLIKQKPILGWGTGRFANAYRTVEPDPSLQTDNPHNEYLNIAVQSGMLGITLWLWLLASLWNYSDSLCLADRLLSRGVFWMMTIGCLANSWLLDSTEGHLFALMVAMCLASARQTAKPFPR